MNSREKATPFCVVGLVGLAVWSWHVHTLQTQLTAQHAQLEKELVTLRATEAVNTRMLHRMNARVAKLERSLSSDGASKERPSESVARTAVDEQTVATSAVDGEVKGGVLPTPVSTEDQYTVRRRQLLTDVAATVTSEASVLEWETPIRKQLEDFSTRQNVAVDQLRCGGTFCMANIAAESQATFARLGTGLAAQIASLAEFVAYENQEDGTVALVIAKNAADIGALQE